jgi:NAD(P)-dependent dehydrogenase (short-subunit alcohol dehydrogenase family)
MNLKPINQQVVVIAGGTSGIGRAAALEFAARGAKVVIGGRSTAATETLAHDIQRRGGEAIPVIVDVSSYEQVRSLANKAVETYGRIDTWVHAAGVAMYAPFLNTSADEFKRMIEVNLLGQVYGAMAAVPHIKREGQGALIHISSVTGKQSVPLQSAYSASKHGIIGFLDAMREEFKHDRVPISVTNIAPSSINTPFFTKALTKTGLKPRPLPPVYEPELVVDAILYAAENPVREVIIGGAGKGLSLLQRLSPQLAASSMQRTAYELQLTDEHKPSNAPHNLFEHVYGLDTVKGEWGEEAVRVSPMTKTQYRPAARWALALTLAILAGAFIIRPALQARRMRRMSYPQRLLTRFNSWRRCLFCR